MRLIRTYSVNGQDAFSIVYSCIKRHGIYEHELVTTLPQECLDFVHYSFFCRMTPEYLPGIMEAYKMMEKLANEIRSVQQFRSFYFANFLLFNGKMMEQQLKELLKTQKGFKLQQGKHFCENTRSLEFSVILKELYRFKIFEKKKFTQRFIKGTRKEFEEVLAPGRMSLDYIELYREENEFYCLKQDGMTFYFLCNKQDVPLMTIAHN